MTSRSRHAHARRHRDTRQRHVASVSLFSSLLLLVLILIKTTCPLISCDCVLRTITIYTIWTTKTQRTTNRKISKLCNTLRPSLDEGLCECCQQKSFYSFSVLSCLHNNNYSTGAVSKRKPQLSEPKQCYILLHVTCCYTHYVTCCCKSWSCSSLFCSCACDRSSCCLSCSLSWLVTSFCAWSRESCSRRSAITQSLRWHSLSNEASRLSSSPIRWSRSSCD